MAQGDPLTVSATPARLRALRAAGVLDDDHLREGLRLAAETPPAERWSGFLSALLLLVGAALSLSGVVYFFAYNWEALDRFAQLGLIQGGILIAFVSAWWLGLEALSGRVSLLAASVGVGILLAVYGQIYQTGADDWELFSTWSLLIIPWVLIGRMPGLWMLELVLINLGIILWKIQINPGADLQEMMWLPLGLAVLNGGAAAVWAGLDRATDWPWLSAAWLPRVLTVAALVALLFPSVAVVFEPVEAGLSGWLGLGLLGTATVGVWALAAVSRRLDLFLPTATAGTTLVVLNAGLGRLLLEELGLDALGFLLLAVSLIVQAALAIAGLLLLQRRRSP